MVKFDSREAFIFETTIRAIDLIKIANQLYQDKMQYVKLGIDYSNDIEKMVVFKSTLSPPPHPKM